MRSSRIISYFEKRRSVAHRQLKDCGLRSCKAGFQLPGWKCTTLPQMYIRSKVCRLRALGRYVVPCGSSSPAGIIQPMALSSIAPLEIRTRVLGSFVYQSSVAMLASLLDCLVHSVTPWRDFQASKAQRRDRPHSQPGDALPYNAISRDTEGICSKESKFTDIR